MTKARQAAGIDLSALGIGELLALSRTILAELRRRGVIRTGNAPAGDYAELLVQRATSGELAPNSQKRWDVLAGDGERLQVKARVVTDPRANGERQLSVFRSWDFDAAVVVLGVTWFAPTSSASSTPTCLFQKWPEDRPTVIRRHGQGNGGRCDDRAVPEGLRLNPPPGGRKPQVVERVEACAYS